MTRTIFSTCGRLSKSCHFFLHNIFKMQPFLSVHTARTLVQILILQLQYYNIPLLILTNATLLPSIQTQLQKIAPPHTHTLHVFPLNPHLYYIKYKLLVFTVKPYIAFPCCIYYLYCTEPPKQPPVPQYQPLFSFSEVFQQAPSAFSHATPYTQAVPCSNPQSHCRSLLKTHLCSQTFGMTNQFAAYYTNQDSVTVILWYSWLFVISTCCLSSYSLERESSFHYMFVQCLAQ